MAKIKLVINDSKEGKSYSDEVENDAFIGLKINDEIKGDEFGYDGYKFKITGGSDNAGFPMRNDIEGTNKRKIFSGRTIGLKTLNGAQRIKKLVAGNTIYERTSQLNLKILKKGKKSLDGSDDKKEEKEEEKKE
ncbi:MAG: S6e family ribosomal protein [Candidatus Woesearchaeota archaeon]